MSLTGFDESRVWTSATDRVAQQVKGSALAKSFVADEEPRAIIAKFKDFIVEFRQENTFIYRNQLLRRVNVRQYFLEVQLEHLAAFDESLYDALRSRPEHYIPLFEQAAHSVAVERCLTKENKQTVQTPQIIFTGDSAITTLRELTHTYIGRLVSVPGIVISASRNSARATEIAIICRTCTHQRTLPCPGGMSSVVLPRVCERGRITDEQGQEKVCPKDPYVVLGDYSKFVDEQMLKLQETPETVPTGEMPRHIMLHCDRYLADRAVPGTRVTVMGIYSVFNSRGKAKENGTGSVAIRHPYIRVLGLNVDVEGAGRLISSFDPAEESLFMQFSKLPNAYELIWRSMAPALWGNEDIKKAIACLLFGGSRKLLPDGMKLRGDINCLLLGDPGTAKSQFLKFVEKIAPIGVYTSGKGSSAAGLTASVIREPGTRQFYLEGGACVLADGGVVCIDEFDKMHSHDRVAIHEAMEQQTISIAKAGITTILNARSSVLAAANPVFGSYDDSHSPFENIEFQSTILSRFDMIFLVKDAKNEDQDRRVAGHVIGLHLSGSQPLPKDASAVDPQFLKRYIAFCRARCAPRLSKDAGETLQQHYVELRSSMLSQGGSAVPITVRQLEAIIRISESLAKMSLSPSATPEHVREAIRLFTVSTVEAAASGKENQGEPATRSLAGSRGC
eukprot:TRINITY_DN3032_c0_g2_i1.p1 TRINITY_DN3032_c0_g2~~TRINITY_DN3032_c0_g2_i1.p1  ORF type:complete len:676 (+),score=69.50 TRINITY_DN3032_c0_g2_i1:885-2912(+)